LAWPSEVKQLWQIVKTIERRCPLTAKFSCINSRDLKNSISPGLTTNRNSNLGNTKSATAVLPIGHNTTQSFRLVHFIVVRATSSLVQRSHQISLTKVSLSLHRYEVVVHLVVSMPKPGVHLFNHVSLLCSPIEEFYGSLRSALQLFSDPLICESYFCFFTRAGGSCD
jgi:hypothetical protein